MLILSPEQWGWIRPAAGCGQSEWTAKRAPAQEEDQYFWIPTGLQSFLIIYLKFATL